ncbi:MAG TPA: serine hydrolase [Dinghuibacter sp.]|jgi:beta-lactamase class A|uniref:serine hydrolase n=1 Tax=Dinghuibacter sp. TaxID=2024697 RepID=UPI002B9DD971|nr:serine hydrolase [Dinghuibacter sp.]HTJ13246.1 serine hydrolase [Dinghuibacter sp.]
MRLWLCVFLAFTATGLHGQELSAQRPDPRPDRRLQRRLDTLVRGFHGDVGIYVYDPVGNRFAALGADTVFPTASIVKVGILIGIMDRIRAGALDYHQRCTYTDSLYLKEGDDILSNFKPGSTIELSKLMMLMLTISDNCASLWLQGLAGGGGQINRVLDSLGFTQTRDNSHAPGREAERARYGWGQTTPREIVHIFDQIVRGQVLGADASARMLRLLGRQYWDEIALSQIPAGVFVADKNGALDANRNEVAYVNDGRHPYFFAIFTKNNADTRWTPDNEAWTLTRRLSSLLWGYYR